MKVRVVFKNETIQTVILMAIMIAGVATFWFGLGIVLRTEYPLLAVISKSMLPTLNVGDYIVVQGVNASEIKAEKIIGDIIVFPSPGPRNSGELIVHRAIGKTRGNDGELYFQTRGDNNDNAKDSWKIRGDTIVGKVIARVPYLGNISLFTHTQQGTYLIILLFLFLIFLILIDSILPSEKEEKAKSSNSQQNIQKSKPIEEMLKGRVIFVIILNVLLLGLAVFSLWSSLTFWQPGADPQQYVTIHGMYSDLHFHESFKKRWNNVTEAFLSQGFVTYKIDSLVRVKVDSLASYAGRRPGVPTFSWAQFSTLVLLIFDSLVVIDHWRKGVSSSEENHRSAPN